MNVQVLIDSVVRQTTVLLAQLATAGGLPPDVNALEPVDPALLVAGAVSTVDVGGGLALQRLIAQDDTQITLAVLGLGGMPCSLQQDGRCVPEPIATSSRGSYLDGQCTQPAFDISPIETCGRNPLGVRTIDDAVHVYELVLNEAVFILGTGPKAVER